jgi:group I intron endonuclease
MDIYNCSGIYKIINKLNGKIYIGSTINFRLRKNLHFSRLERNVHENKHIQNAYNKYGKENLNFKILFICNKELLTFFEQIVIDKLKPEYNICKKADRPNPRIYTEDMKIKVSKEHKGKIISNDTRKKISESHLGKKLSKEHIENIRISHIGHSTSNKQKETVSKVMTGNTYNAKIYKGLISPEGIKYRNIFNLSKFCREHCLDRKIIGNVISGKAKQHKGWKSLGGVI